MVAHHGPDLPCTAGAEELGDIPVGNSGSRRDELNQGEHRLDILRAHESSLTVFPGGPGRRGKGPDRTLGRRPWEAGGTPAAWHKTVCGSR